MRNDRCAPRVREFAKDYPVEKVVGDTAHTTKLTSQAKDSGDVATAKTTTAKISNPAAVRKIEKAQVESKKKEADEPATVSYQRKTLFRRLPVLQDNPAGSGSVGGTTKTQSARTAPSDAATSGDASKAQTASPVKTTPKPVHQHAADDPDSSAPGNRSSSKPTPKGIASNPAASKRAPVADPSSSHGGSSTSSTFGERAAGAGNVMNIVLSNVQNKLMNIANSHPDPEVARAMRDIDTVLKAKSYVDELKSFATNPARWSAKALKTAGINAVFDHFEGVLNDSASRFLRRFPAVDELRHDPLGTGVGLEEYRRKYNAARAALRTPDGRKAFLYTGVLLTTQGQPDAVVEARFREANEILAKMPGTGEYIRNYHEAQNYYVLALDKLRGDIKAFNTDLLGQPAAFVEELRLRSEAVAKAQVALEEAAQEILPFAVFAPIEEAYFDLTQLADGFGSLSNGLSGLADLVDSHRRGEYRVESERR